MTTTDPVYKAMELLPLGPVMLIDTPGLDDEGELGALRVQKGLDVLRKTDIALLIVDGSSGMGPEDEQLEAELQKRGLPYLVVFNKMDLCKEDFYKKDFNKKDFCKKDERHIWVSARTGEGIEELKERLARLVPEKEGNLAQTVRGALALETLADGDRILISEGCTHHRQCNDIGTVKLPGWIEAYTGKKPEFDFTSGTGFERDLSRYHMVVHCGGCMLNEQEMQYRLGEAAYQGIPMTNYGILIAYMKGILKRSLKPFPEVAGLLDEQGRLTDRNAGNTQ